MKYIKIPQVAFKWQAAITIGPRVECALDAYDAMKQVFADYMGGQEVFAVMCMNAANKPINVNIINIGGITSTQVDLRVLFLHAIKSRATSIIVAHNHPSGILKPSQADERLTKKIAEGGAILGIHLLDHLILSDEGYYSFADNGQL